MSGIAAYPMYNLPQMQSWNERWLQGLAKHFREQGLDAPENIIKASAEDRHWLSDDLFLSQTCGYPLTHALAGKVQYVATPCYDTPYNDGASYCSVILVAADDPAQSLSETAGYRLAFNSEDSQSGYRVLLYELVKAGMDIDVFAETITTGAHAGSIEKIRCGEADVCAIDCVTFSLIQKYQPGAVEGVRVLQTTSLAPGLPLITCLRRPIEQVHQMRQALRHSLQDPELGEVHQALLIRDYQVLETGHYDRIKMMERTCS